MDTAETERLCEREAESGVEQETEEEEALLEPEAEPELEPVPEVSSDDSDVHSQNWREPEQRRGGGEDKGLEHHDHIKTVTVFCC